jgi:hypothetical protein
MSQRPTSLTASIKVDVTFNYGEEGPAKSADDEAGIYRKTRRLDDLVAIISDMDDPYMCDIVNRFAEQLRDEPTQERESGGQSPE